MNLSRLALHFFVTLAGIDLVVLTPISAAEIPIDRHALVARHDIDWPDLKGEIPLGNGNFAFNADGTGLETFAGNTMSHWCWHSFPLPDGVLEKEVVPWAAVESGRLQGRTTPPARLKLWQTINPHPLNLGRLGFVDEVGRRLPPSDIQVTDRHLDLWTGLLTTHFTVKGTPVTVETCVDPQRYVVAVRAISPLLKSGALRVMLDFPAAAPYGSTDSRQSMTHPWTGDFSNDEGHRTEVGENKAGELDLRRMIDGASYSVRVAGPGIVATVAPGDRGLQIRKARYGPRGKEALDVTSKVVAVVQNGGIDLAVKDAVFDDTSVASGKCLNVDYRLDGIDYSGSIAEGQVWRVHAGPSPHRFEIRPADSDTLELTCEFQPTPLTVDALGFGEVRQHNADAWPIFWKSGGAIDFSGSTDPRWQELERRVVLSQYEMAVNSAGDYPPSEGGLTGTDAWAAKFHMEMVWWHLAHWALWNRWEKADKAIGFYRTIQGTAHAIAGHFDYPGLLWPKATGPGGYNEGHPPTMVLLWREPHPIFLAELEYRLHPTRATLDKWKDVVFGVADFMADYPTLDKASRIYSLDPVWPAWEGPMTKNTIFELAYWRYGLATAQKWRERLNLARDTKWDAVLAHLAPLPVQDGLYIYSSERADTYTARNFDHLDIIGACGMLPPVAGYDPEIGHRTVLETAKNWKWDALWGWDFPWLAMAAASVGEPKLAVDALLNPSRKNHYDERGLCKGPYFPGNGGLLYAVALMAAGWDGAPDRPAPGFPADGTWKVRFEDLKPAP